VEQTQLQTIEQLDAIRALVKKHLPQIADSVAFVNAVKHEAQTSGIAIKNLFQFMRLALMGTVKGPAIHELIDVLGHEKAQKRIEHLLS
jgi:glutamyl/glutaminyl-tRNA synthetase